MRKAKPKKRVILPDPVFNDTITADFPLSAISVIIFAV